MDPLQRTLRFSVFSLRSKQSTRWGSRGSLPRISEDYVTKFAPHFTLKSIARGKLTFYGRGWGSGRCFWSTRLLQSAGVLFLEVPNALPLNFSFPCASSSDTECAGDSRRIWGLRTRRCSTTPRAASRPITLTTTLSTSPPCA